MSERYFLDLPVYRLTEERYYRDRAAFVDVMIFPPDTLDSERRRADEKKNVGSLAGIRDRLEKTYGGCWRYNEIVGYIRLHFLGSQVRGEYYGVNRRRVVRTRTRQLERKTWNLAAELDIPRGATNSDIFTVVVRYVEACRGKLGGRYIDDSQLLSLGPHLNWRELYDRLPTRTAP